jgi:hypothetical protein
VPLPAWLASMTRLPGAVQVTVVPDTRRTHGSLEGFNGEQRPGCPGRRRWPASPPGTTLNPTAAWLTVAARTRRRTGRLFRPLPAKE